MICFDEKYAEIKWDELNRVVILTCRGYMTSEQLRGVYEKVLECFIKNKTNKMINDAKNFLTIRAEDQDWLENDWGPRSYKAVGVVKSAGIMPDNLIQKNVIGKVVDTAQQNKVAEIKFFPDISKALMWLRS